MHSTNMVYYYTKEGNAVTEDADTVVGVEWLGSGVPGKYIWWEWWWLAIGWCVLEWRGGNGVGLARNWPTAEALWVDADGCAIEAPVLFIVSVHGVAAATAAAWTALVDATTWCAACAWAAAAAAAWRLAILFCK